MSRTAIQNALVDRARSGTFYKATYNRGIAAPGAPTVPTGAIANETESAWGQSRDMTRPATRERSRWVFELILEFSAEAILSDFEDDLASNPVTVKLPQGCLVRLLLLSADYTHPPQTQPSSGTRAVFQFEAEI